MQHDKRLMAAIEAGHPEWAELPASAKEAKAQGSTHFFTGKTCKYGHTSIKYTSTFGCIECQQDYVRRNRNCPEFREKACEYARNRRQKPDFPEYRRAYETTRYHADPEFRKRKKELDRKRREDPEYKSREREYMLKRREDPEYREQRRGYERKRLEAPEKRAMSYAHTVKRRAAKRNATPPWLTDAMHKEIRRVYRRAAYLTKTTGIPHHVDHIVPLTHDEVQGYHVPWNLQILTAPENLSKNNSFDGTMENEGWRERL